jgi:hypothetical protein
MMEARSSWFSIRSSNHLRRIAARSLPVSARQAGNAASAAAMARLVSVRPIFGTVAIVVPSAGLSTSIAWPSSASSHSPAMKHWPRRRDGSLSLSAAILTVLS